MFDGALLEHGPRLEGLIRLLHALFELFEHLLPSIWVGLLVIVHRLHECHVEVLRGELALFEQLFIFIQVLHLIAGCMVLNLIDSFFHIVAVFVIIVIVVFLPFTFFLFLVVFFFFLTLLGGCSLSFLQ